MPAAAAAATPAPVHPLRALRERRDLTLRALGARARINYRKLHQMEKYGLRPTPTERQRLAAALRVRMTELD